MVYDFVLARQCIFWLAPGEQRGPHPDPGANGARVPNSRQQPTDALNQVASFVRGCQRPVQVTVEVVVGSSDGAGVLPRQDEDLPPVDRLRRDRDVAHGAVEVDMDALAWPEA